MQNRFEVPKTSPIPATPVLDLRHASEVENVVDVSLPEIVGSFLWTANQSKPDITNVQVGQSLVLS